MVSVKEVMSQRVVCVKQDDLVTKARSLMRDRYRALPVLSDDKLVGIVTRGDILKITSSKTNIQVRGLMSKNLVTTSPDEDLRDAARRLVESSVRQLPVVEDGKLLGIISSVDVLAAFIEHGYTPVRKNVGEIMSTNVTYCEVRDEISTIWDRMCASGFAGLPVLKKGEVIGIITRRDILHHGSVRLSKESGSRKLVRVEKAMRTPPITVTPEETTDDVARIMIKRDIARLPVAKGSKLEGIVDIEDILKAYIG